MAPHGPAVNKVPAEAPCAWFEFQNTTPVVNYVERCHLDSNCYQGRGKTIFKGCATCKEVISTSSDISIFQRMPQKEEEGAGCGYGLGSGTLETSLRMRTQRKHTKPSCHPLNISQYCHGSLKKPHIIPNNSQPVML